MFHFKGLNRSYKYCYYQIYTCCIFAIILTMPYPIMPVGVVAGKAMIDGG